MLHHEEQMESPPTAATTGSEPAANVRVTAEEFARAVTRYQTRREQAAQRMEGTVAIGDAVHELGLEATPEEILAEVQAERETQAQSAAQTVVDPSSRPLSRYIPAGAFAAAVLVVLGLSVFNVRTAQPMTTMAAVQIPVSSPLVTMAAAPTLLVQDTSSGKPILRTLAEIPDNVPVQCELEMTASHAALVDFTDGLDNNTWTIIKHDGRVYVRAWIADMSPQALRARTVNLYPSKSMVTFTPTHVTVPVDGFQTNPALGADNTIVAEHIEPDAHFGEHW